MIPPVVPLQPESQASPARPLIQRMSLPRFSISQRPTPNMSLERSSSLMAATPLHSHGVISRGSDGSALKAKSPSLRARPAVSVAPFP